MFMFSSELFLCWIFSLVDSSIINSIYDTTSYGYDDTWKPIISYDYSSYGNSSYDYSSYGDNSYSYSSNDKMSPVQRMLSDRAVLPDHNCYPKKLDQFVNFPEFFLADNQNVIFAIVVDIDRKKNLIVAQG